MKFLVTGVAGFIGHSVARQLCLEGRDVVGLDNLSDYYDVQLKLDRIDNLQSHTLSSKGTFRFVRLNLIEYDAVMTLFHDESFDRIIHLAAKAGVLRNTTHLTISLAAGLTVLYDHYYWR